MVVGLTITHPLRRYMHTSMDSNVFPLNSTRGNEKMSNATIVMMSRGIGVGTGLGVGVESQNRPVISQVRDLVD